ncbi:ead/Ea22-like family protein [Escherichia coli]
MSKIDYQALREAAEKAGEDKWQAKKINGDFFVIRHGSYTRQHGYTSYQPIAEIDCKPVRDFVAKANPATVLELLDELEAAKKRIAELEDEPVSQTYRLNELSGNNPVTPDGWISCSERMPKGYADVLVTDGEHVEVKWWDESGYWNSWTELNSDILAHEMTHWMPLPEPPL